MLRIKEGDLTISYEQKMKNMSLMCFHGRDVPPREAKIIPGLRRGKDRRRGVE